jgi:hypothetical protein
MKKTAPSILIAVVLLAVGVITEAQQPAKVRRIGYLGLDIAINPGRFDAFRQGLRQLGVYGRERYYFGDSKCRWKT